MNSNALRIGRFLIFSVASAREKALAVFVVLCIVANALVPKFTVDAKDYSTLCQIMKSQSVLFEFFSFSSIPVKIVSELFTQRCGMSPLSPRKKAPKDDTKNTSNTSSDFSITASNVKDVSSRYSSQRGHGIDGNPGAVFRKTPGVYPCARTSGAPPGEYFAILMILMFYFLRARSALPDAAINYLCAINKPNSKFELGFFIVNNYSQRELL